MKGIVAQAYGLHFLVIGIINAHLQYRFGVLYVQICLKKVFVVEEIA